MSKRSKVALIILIILVVMTLFSLVFEDSPNDNNLDEWEEEIIDPNNNLDPLNERVDNTVFILNIANKIESIINSVFSFVINFFEGLLNKILIFIL